MKSFKVIILSLLLFICNACKKEDKQTAETEGTWELKSSTNGMTGKVETYPVDNGKLIIFSEGNYQIFSDHKMTRSGTFKIVEETSLIHKQKGKRLIYDNELDQIRTFLDIKGDELEIYVDAFDGPSALYVKK